MRPPGTPQHLPIIMGQTTFLVASRSSLTHRLRAARCSSIIMERLAPANFRARRCSLTTQLQAMVYLLTTAVSSATSATVAALTLETVRPREMPQSRTTAAQSSTQAVALYFSQIVQRLLP